MIYRFLITAIILIGMFILVYKLLTREPTKKEKAKKELKFFEPFKSPFFKIPLGVLITAFTLVYSFRVVKMVPILMKVGLIGLNFVVIYIVINYLFINNKQKSN